MCFLQAASHAAAVLEVHSVDFAAVDDLTLE